MYSRIRHSACAAVCGWAGSDPCPDDVVWACGCELTEEGGIISQANWRARALSPEFFSCQVRICRYLMVLRREERVSSRIGHMSPGDRALPSVSKSGCLVATGWPPDSRSHVVNV